MKNKLYTGSMALAALLALASCSDFTDYNEASGDSNPTGNKTLWENICDNPDLSNFKTLVERAGFSEALNSSHYYTVWAPTNDNLNLGDYEGYTAAQLLKQFVENHVADYNFTISNDTSTRVTTLNDKRYTWQKADGTTFDGIDVLTRNIGCSNGVMHTLGGVVAYFPNAYDYILDGAEGIDSLQAYFAKYELTTLDEERSVVGSIVDGKQTYVDSVMTTDNQMTRRLRAYLDREDSTYTVLALTNEGWNKEYDKAKEFHNVLSKTQVRTFDANGNASTTNVERNATYLADSLARRSVVEKLFYSNNDGYNKWLIGSADKLADTIRTTLQQKVGNPGTLLAHELSRVSLSNGQAIVVDTLDANSWDLYSGKLTFNASDNYATLSGGSASRQSITPDTLGNYRTFSFLNIDPASNAQPTVKIYLPNVLSDTYQVYLAFAPAFDPLKEEVDTLPNRFYVSIEYCQANGNLVSKEEYFINGDSLNRTTSASKAATAKKRNDFYTHAGYLVKDGQLSADTVYIGQVTFPVSYSGVSENGRGPVLKVMDATTAFDKDRAQYSKRYRIMSVILKPVELDAYEKKTQSK